jgi:hypothetical protein
LIGKPAGVSLHRQVTVPGKTEFWPITIVVGIEMKSRSNMASAARAAAERMRAHRERRRSGMRCVIVELHDSEIDAMVKFGWLDPETRNDPTAIAGA